MHKCCSEALCTVHTHSSALHDQAYLSIYVLRRLALCPLTAPLFAALTTLSSPFLAAACLPALLFNIFLSRGQYAYGSTLLPPLVSPLAPFLALNLHHMNNLQGFGSKGTNAYLVKDLSSVCTVKACQIHQLACIRSSCHCKFIMLLAKFKIPDT